MIAQGAKQLLPLAGCPLTSTGHASCHHCQIASQTLGWMSSRGVYICYLQKFEQEPATQTGSVVAINLKEATPPHIIQFVDEEQRKQ